MKKKITIVDKDLNQLVVVADCSSALYQDRGTKLGEQNLLSDTAVTFKVYGQQPRLNRLAGYRRGLRGNP